MVTTDWVKFREFKDNGLVKDVFSNKAVMDKLTGGAGGGGWCVRVEIGGGV
jgi:amidophosphoribosyltransferase